MAQLTTTHKLGETITSADINAIAQTVDDLVYDVTNWGAKGDGVADDRAAIAAADVAAVVNGGTVFFPPGTYRVASNLTITSPVQFSSGAKLSIPTGVTVTLNGALAAPITQIFSTAGTGKVTFTPASVGLGVVPQWWGALGDGVQDDQPYIQAALDALMGTVNRAGTLRLPLPKLYYRINTTIRVYTAAYDQVHINIIAEQGQNGVNISWFGTTDVNAGGIGMYVINNIGFTFERVFLSASAVGAAGTHIGLLLSSNSSGTGTQNGRFIGCGVEYWAIGLQVGGGTIANGAASEMMFINLLAQRCTTGVFLTQQNSLDLFFKDLIMQYNATWGFRTVTGAVCVDGGSSSFNGTDFNVGSAAGQVTIMEVRSESATGSFLTSSTPFLTLIGCTVATTPGTGVFHVTHTGQNLVMINNQLNGSVNVSDSIGPIDMIGNSIVPIGTMPFQSNATSGVHTQAAPIYNCRSNYSYAGVQLDDVVGAIEFAATESAGVHLFNATHYSRMGRNYKAISSAYQELRRVQGISATEVQAKNLRGTAVLAAGTAAVVFGQGEQQTISITGAPTGGNFHMWNAQQVSPDANLAWNATAAQVATYINDMLNIGSGVVTTTGGPLPATPIVVNYSGVNGPMLMLWVAHALSGGVSPAVSVVRNRAGSVVEADAAYFIALSANITGETFSVTAKATGGFTITSSNVNSTASVDWILIR